MGPRRNNRINKSNAPKDETPWKIRRITTKAEKEFDPKRDAARGKNWEVVKKMTEDRSEDVSKLFRKFSAADEIIGSEPLSERLEKVRKSNAADISIKIKLGIPRTSDQGWYEEGEVKYTSVTMKGFSNQELQRIVSMEEGAKTQKRGTENQMGSMEMGLEAGEILNLAKIDINLLKSPAAQAGLYNMKKTNKFDYDRLIEQHPEINGFMSRSSNAAFNQVFNVNRPTVLASFLRKAIDHGKYDDPDQLLLILKNICSDPNPDNIMTQIQETLSITANDFEDMMVRGTANELHMSPTIMTPARLASCLSTVTSLPAMPESLHMLSNPAAAVSYNIEVYDIEAAAGVEIKKSVNAFLRFSTSGYESKPCKNVSRVDRDFTSVDYVIRPGAKKEIITEVAGSGESAEPSTSLPQKVGPHDGVIC